MDTGANRTFQHLAHDLCQVYGHIANDIFLSYTNINPLRFKDNVSADSYWENVRIFLDEMHKILYTKEHKLSISSIRTEAYYFLCKMCIDRSFSVKELIDIRNVRSVKYNKDIANDISHISLPSYITYLRQIPSHQHHLGSSTGPGFTSVYSYDETLANGDKNDGWTPATSITNPTSPSSAHRMYLGANTFNLDFKGTPGYGTYHFSLSYENATSAEAAAPEDQKGWNFIGNPYPCPISWDALTKVNIDDQIWIYSAENGNYGLYVGGAGSGTGTNSVDRKIPAHQGVWVHANAYGASINITEAAKQDVSASLVKSQTESPFFNESVTESIIEPSALPAAALVISADAAMFSISSCLFTLYPFVVVVYDVLHIPMQLPCASNCYTQ